LVWQGLLARLLRFTRFCINIKTACDTQRQKHTITVFLYFTHTLLLARSLALSLAHTHTHTHTHGVDSIGGINTCLVQPSTYSCFLPVAVPPLCVLYWRCFWPLFCAIEPHRFLFLLIEITFIFLIVLKLVMSCTLPYLHVTA
jgi:hypothetical protein